MITKAHLNVAVLIIIIHCVVQQVTMNYTLYSVDCQVKALSFSQSLPAILHLNLTLTRFWSTSVISLSCAISDTSVCDDLSWLK